MNKITDDAIFNELRFNNIWIESGVINDESFLSIKKKYQDFKDEDNHTEHYRWAAFKSFLGSNRQISTDTFYLLYNLGKNDPDYPMGHAIIFEIIGRPECPIEIIETAINDDNYSLSKHAMKCKNARLNI
jgi:hypothetical protein